MEETYGGYLDPGSGRSIIFAHPAAQPELWVDYIDGARTVYRRHGVDNALDYDRVRDGHSTVLFVAAVELDAQVVGGLRVQGPYTRVEQASALDEWAEQDGAEQLRREIADRLSDGVIEIKAAWVDRAAARHHSITDAIARAFVHSMHLLNVRHALCTAATHAIPRWQSTGGVVSNNVAAVAFPDQRYRTVPMWWDREHVFESAADGQFAALVRESRLLANATTRTQSVFV